MRFFLFLTLLAFLKPFNLSAQELSMYQYEDSLKVLGNVIINDTTETARSTANEKFIKTLINALKTKGSFNYKFSRLQNIVSIVTPEDRKFRVFTWFVFSRNGNFRYYGAIQMSNPEKLELIPLIDGTQELENGTEQTLLPSSKWLGSVYYNITPVTGKPFYYILLGWKGNSIESSSKVIETLSFENGRVVFGKPVFQQEPKSNIYLARRVFTYNSDASMFLRYIKNDKVFAFDHLVPPHQEFQNSKDKYIPDLTYDGYKYKNGKWIYVEDLDLKNLPDEKDDSFVDPSKITPSSIPIRKY
ncbi:hypothetical protein [Pseudopedobacter beijingensis]|uniref:Uncharacterized protein n=1 Tax=Pseudopedobacter beijingensis TaxID=1207056 RepID=A0ABW4IG11_9SPHI